MIPIISNIFIFATQRVEHATNFFRHCAHTISEHCAMHSINQQKQETVCLIQQEQALLLTRQKHYARMHNDQDSVILHSNFALDLGIIEGIAPDVPPQLMTLQSSISAIVQYTAARKMLALHPERKNQLNTAFVIAIKAMEQEIYGTHMYDEAAHEQYMYTAHKILDHVYQRCSMLQSVVHVGAYRHVYINEMTHLLRLLYTIHVGSNNVGNNIVLVDALSILQQYITRGSDMRAAIGAKHMRRHSSSILMLRSTGTTGTHILDSVSYMTQIFTAIVVQVEIQRILHSNVSRMQDKYIARLAHHTIKHNWTAKMGDGASANIPLAYQLTVSHAMKALYFHYLSAMLCGYSESVIALLRAQNGTVLHMHTRAHHAVDTYAQMLMCFNDVFNKIEKQLGWSLRAQIAIYVSFAESRTLGKHLILNRLQLLRTLQADTDAQKAIATKIQYAVFHAQNIKLVFDQVFRRYQIHVCGESLQNIVYRVFDLTQHNMYRYVYSMLVQLVSLAQHDAYIVRHVHQICTQISLRRQEQCAHVLSGRAPLVQGDQSNPLEDSDTEHENDAQNPASYMEILFPFAAHAVQTAILNPPVSNNTTASQLCTYAQNYVDGSTLKTQLTKLTDTTIDNDVYYIHHFVIASLAEILHYRANEYCDAKLISTAFSVTKVALYSAWALIVCHAMRMTK